MSVPVGRNCPNCNSDSWSSIDNPTEYNEVCDKCLKMITFSKITPKKEFECENCHSTECIELDTDLDYSLMCAKCKTTKVIFEKHNIIVNNRNMPKRSEEEIQQSAERIKQMFAVKCPKCGSTEFTTGKRGFSALTGFFGSNKTVNRCARCGNVWYPKM